MFLVIKSCINSGKIRINLITSSFTVHWEFSTAQSLHLSLLPESISCWSTAVKANLRRFERDVLKWPIPVTAWCWHCAISPNPTPLIHGLSHQIPLFTTNLIFAVCFFISTLSIVGVLYQSDAFYITRFLDLFSRFTLWIHTESTTSSRSICQLVDIGIM